jgi:cell division septal protein FtsQ
MSAATVMILESIKNPHSVVFLLSLLIMVVVAVLFLGWFMNYIHTNKVSK